MLGRNNRSEDVVSEIISFALGERFESIVRPDDPQNDFHTASVIRVILIVRRALPVYPDEQTISEPVGTSHLFQNRTLEAGIQHA